MKKLIQIQVMKAPQGLILYNKKHRENKGLVIYSVEYLVFGLFDDGSMAVTGVDSITRVNDIKNYDYFANYSVDTDISLDIVEEFVHDVMESEVTGDEGEAKAFVKSYLEDFFPSSLHYIPNSYFSE